MKINPISPDKSNFLQIVSSIAKNPKRLWYVGNLPTTRLPTVAIIGSRKPTTYGCEVAYQLAFDLAKSGVVVVSGLALGVDSIAHRGALEAGGTTVAVMAGGLDRIHPSSHRELAKQIVTSGGALISEYASCNQVYKGNFVARNRIVSGLSDAVIVVEAAARSGTLHTVNFALEQGRAVLAVPGNITSPLSQGCNNLIKTGARPLTDAQDVLDELGLTQKAQMALPLGDSREEQIILDLLKGGLRDGDDLRLASKLSPTMFSQTLSMLEITGKIKALGANRWGTK